MYVLLSRARINAGDFLITERAVALLRALRPAHEVVVRPAWEPLAQDDAAVRAADAIIIGGGPGYRPRMVPDVYPLAADLEELPCPVVPLGVGWKGRTAGPDALRDYRFDEPSLRALSIMARRGPGLGCRDRASVDVLRMHGLPKATLVGCPVWYDLESIGAPVRLPGPVRRLVFTPPQELALFDQSIAAATELARLFPAADRVCSFHYGFDQASQWVSEERAAGHRRIAKAVRSLGYDVVDVSGDGSGLSLYQDCCLHVGYRLHAHLYFLSKRRPSLLFHEDGRGIAASQTLGVLGVDAYVPLLDGWLVGKLPRRVGRRLAAAQRPAPWAVEEAMRLLRHDVDTDFARFAGLSEVLDRHFERMRDFVARLPGR